MNNLKIIVKWMDKDGYSSDESYNLDPKAVLVDTISISKVFYDRKNVTVDSET